MRGVVATRQGAVGVEGKTAKETEQSRNCALELPSPNVAPLKCK